MNLVVIGVHTLYGPPDISDVIRQYKQDSKNRVLIFPYWETEYKRTHNVYQKNPLTVILLGGRRLLINLPL